MTLGMPVWLQVMRRVEKHRAWALAAMGMLVTLPAALMVRPGPAAFVPMVLVTTSFGFFLGLSSIAQPSLLADIVDYGLWKNRKEHAASFFSFRALVTTLNQGIGGAVALAITGLFGFEAKQALTERWVTGLRLGFVAWPCLLLIPMLVMAWRYPPWIAGPAGCFGAGLRRRNGAGTSTAKPVQKPDGRKTRTRFDQGRRGKRTARTAPRNVTRRVRQSGGGDTKSSHGSCTREVSMTALTLLAGLQVSGAWLSAPHATQYRRQLEALSSTYRALPVRISRASLGIYSLQDP